MSDTSHRSRRVDFERINRAALANAEAVMRGLLPDGRREGREWLARNPRRAHVPRRLGTFKVNLDTGVWKDFANGDGGADLVSLAAHVAAVGQRDAAIRLAESLTVDPFA